MAPAAGDDDALRAWLHRHPRGTRFQLRGKRVGTGSHQGLLLASIEPRPPRWKHDRWPLGAVVRVTEQTIHNEELGSAPRTIVGHVVFEAQDRRIRGHVVMRDHGSDFLGFSLGSAAATVVALEASCDGYTLPPVEKAHQWALVVPEPPCDLVMDYEIEVTSQRFDHWDSEIVLLSRDAWLPGPMVVGAPSSIDVVLEGMDSWKVRVGGAVERVAGGWRLTGSGDELGVLAARREWQQTSAVIDGCDVSVAAAPSRTPHLDEILVRAGEALRAIQDWHPCPRRIRITEVPAGRAPRTTGGHIVLPQEHLAYNPLGLAHEVSHTLFRDHTHPPGGMPSVEEPLVEYLSLLAARGPAEAIARRREWQHLMEVREGKDGRALVEAYRKATHHYSRGGLVLSALGRRMGSDALLDLLSPPAERAAVPWTTFVARLSAGHPEHGAWLEALATATHLPKPEVRQEGDLVRVVDAAKTGVAVDVEVEYHDAEGLISSEMTEVGALLDPPPRTEWIVLDPQATAPIRRHRDTGGRVRIR